MLTGHESLLRVIGKRRRFLPNRNSIISASTRTFQSFSGDCQEDQNLERDSVENGSDAGGDVSESVNCPVCGLQFSGRDNALINSHLDECLTKGSKRKLSQLTLLQLNFSRSKVKVHSNTLENTGNKKTHLPFQRLKIQSHTNRISTRPATQNSYELDSYEECDNNQHSVAVRNSPSENCVEILSANDIGSNKFASAPSLLEIENFEHVHEECLDEFDISQLCISTSIVGRRFAGGEELDPESRICLRRDPENANDQNAIKVLYAGCEVNNMLGYIPRELAQYLSPLIDKFDLNFEGSITSIPKDSRIAVPIQIVCKNVDFCNQKYCDSIQDFKDLWRRALHTVELASNNPPWMIRYQHNVRLLIQEALKGSQHLFTINEKSFLDAFHLLPDDSQRLFARLYTRKGPWFRTYNISYAEIADCQQAIKHLVEAGYLCSYPRSNAIEENDLAEVLNTLNIDELREALRVINKAWHSKVDIHINNCTKLRSMISADIANKLKCNHVTRKQGMIDLLLSSSKDGLCLELQSFLLAVTGSCVKVSPQAESLVWRAERLFFLNGEQDLSSFLLVDLGLVKYPAYNCIISGHVFSERSDLLSYEEAIEISQIMDESLAENNYELVLRCIDISVSRMGKGRSSSSGSMVAISSYFSASWIYSKVVLLGVSFLEREKRYIDAVNLLRQLLKTFVSDGRRGYWTLRLSVDLEHLGRVDDSLQVAEDGLPDPWVRAGSRVALQRRVLRLGKPPRRWKIPSYSNSVKRKIIEVHIQGRPLNCKTGMKSVFYGEDGERCGVEQLALQYYAGEGGGWLGVHTESGIWLTIFGILMWDIIFADVQNVFRTKFQTAPLDLETDSFYEVRKNLIEALLEKIQDGMAEEILITSWESNVGTACRGVNWEKHSLSDLRAVVKCIGGQCLSSICRHLAQDYRSWSSGMPDLLLWRLHDCYRGEAKLVEVKGPRDRLSEQQRAWLLVLMDCGFNVEVCKVTPVPVET